MTTIWRACDVCGHTGPHTQDIGCSLCECTAVKTTPTGNLTNTPCSVCGRLTFEGRLCCTPRESTTDDELFERVSNAVSNLLATVEQFADEDVEINLPKEDLVGVLQGRWIVATLNHDDEYLEDHSWEAACEGRFS